MCINHFINKYASITDGPLGRIYALIVSFVPFINFLKNHSKHSNYNKINKFCSDSEQGFVKFVGLILEHFPRFNGGNDSCDGYLHLLDGPSQYLISVSISSQRMIVNQKVYTKKHLMYYYGHCSAPSNWRNENRIYIYMANNES